MLVVIKISYYFYSNSSNIGTDAAHTLSLTLNRLQNGFYLKKENVIIDMIDDLFFKELII